MKYVATSFIAVALFGCTSIPRLEKSETANLRVPLEFDSIDSANSYAEGLMPDGAIEHIKVGRIEVLVLNVRGSGFPDISFTVYRKEKESWQSIGYFRAPSNAIHQVVEVNGSLLLESGEGKRWLLLTNYQLRAKSGSEGH